MLLANHGDAGFRDSEAPLAIMIRVKSDFDPLGNDDTLVDDGTADSGLTTDVHSLEQNGIFHMGPAVDTDPWPENRPLDLST